MRPNTARCSGDDAAGACGAALDDRVRRNVTRSKDDGAPTRLHTALGVLERVAAEDAVEILRRCMVPANMMILWLLAPLLAWDIWWGAFSWR